MEAYKKPAIVHVDSATGLIPLAGLSAAKLMAAGVALGWGILSAKGGNVIDSSRTKILSARKNFALG